MSKIQMAPNYETERRRNAINAFLVLLHPDDEEWAEDVEGAFISDESQIWDMTDLGDTDESVKQTLWRSLPGIELNLNLYLWQLVDSIKVQLPGWPEYRNKSI